MRLFLIFMAATLPSFVAGCAGAGDITQNNAVPPVTTQTAASPVASPSPIPGLPTSVPANSIYTDVHERVCKDVKPGPDDDGIIYKAECPGTAGYKVINAATDHTQGLTITDPAGKSHNIDFRGPLGSAADLFLGDKIEWRRTGKDKDAKPQAFIIRVNVQKEPGNYDKQDSNLAVVKISKDSICVTDFVAPSEKDQNVKARELSDTAANRPCMKSKFE